MELTNAMILEYSELYLNDMAEDDREEEETLFGVIGPEASRRRFMKKSDLEAVCAWKSGRALGHVRKNEPQLIEDVSRVAFEPSTSERLTCLISLRGVLTPVASAILAVWNPIEHTIIDVRALSALQAAGYFKTHATWNWSGRQVPRVGYGMYLRTCQSIVEQMHVESDSVSPLRRLDRALYKWDEIHSPSS